MYDKRYEHPWAPKTLPEGSEGGGLGEWRTGEEEG